MVSSSKPITEIKLYDTAQRHIVSWHPDLDVSIYVCGITPYDSAHLGHIFTFMTYDLLQRRLEAAGHTVKMIRNVTDVDEPIYKRAAETGVSYTELAVSETAKFQEIMQRLFFRVPAHEPLASVYIQEMAESVGLMLESGHAYHLDEDIYFDVSTDPNFGKFSGFHDGLLLGLMRKRGGDPQRPGKRQPLDFLLWKGISSPDDPAAWESSLGRGRPGWHIECSIMSSHLLGTPFDLHGGGNDLIFPHHECEIAQSHALGEPVMAKHWVHVAAILYGGEKMSKSLGNLVFAADLLETYEPAVIRLALMHYHYREGGEWIPSLLDEAAALLKRLRAVRASPGQCGQLYDNVCAALDNDLDTHSIVHELEDFAALGIVEADSSYDRCQSPDRTLKLLGLVAD